MTRSLTIMPAAQFEIIEAQGWYEKEATGLGPLFRAEIDRQAQRILANPLQFPLTLADIRRARLRRFPYGLFFRPFDDAIYVIACFHSSRDPASGGAGSAFPTVLRTAAPAPTIRRCHPP